MMIPIVYVLLCLSTPELKLVLTLIFTLPYHCSWSILMESRFNHSIHKIGDSFDPFNYRPVTITSLLFKVISLLSGYLEENRHISNRQYDLRPSRSAGNLLVYITHRFATKFIAMQITDDAFYTGRADISDADVDKRRI